MLSLRADREQLYTRPHGYFKLSFGKFPMPSLFRPMMYFTDTEGNRVKKRSPTWYAQFTLPGGRKERIKLSRNKAAAQAKLGDLIKRRELKAAGIYVPETTDASLDDSLAAFRLHLESRSISAKQIHDVHTRVSRVVKLAEQNGAKAIADITTERIEKAFAVIRQPTQVLVKASPKRGKAKMRTKKGAGAGTLNGYRAALRQFFRWAARARGVIVNPIDELPPQDVRRDRRHDRRAFTDAEVSAILKATKDGTPRFHLSGLDRYWLYLVAVSTGLRIKELSKLTPADFDLDAALLSLQGKHTKNAQAVRQPLPESILPALRQYLAERPIDEPVWRAGWWVSHGGKIMKRDLKAAGVPYKDAGGRFGDFHAWRHTYITRLVRAKHSPHVVQKLARHGDVRLTLIYYAHADEREIRAAIASLPPP